MSLNSVIGDRVAPAADLLNLTGQDRETAVHSVGANAPGVLREHTVSENKALVKLPRQLSWDEASLQHERHELIWYFRVLRQLPHAPSLSGTRSTG